DPPGPPRPDGVAAGWSPGGPAVGFAFRKTRWLIVPNPRPRFPLNHPNNFRCLMSSPPLVSIIIPCYRQARFLPGSVGSAVAQTHPGVEVILVDDGSDDDTEAAARAFGDRVRYVRRPNGGPAAARNTGIAEAHGTHLLFLDADDILHPEAVARLTRAAR